MNSFSQAIDQELRAGGVISTVLAPGTVATEFSDTANLADAKFAQNGKSAASVAKIAYDVMQAGKLHLVNETGLSFLTNWIIPLMPRRGLLKMVHNMQSK